MTELIQDKLICIKQSQKGSVKFGKCGVIPLSVIFEIIHLVHTQNFSKN